MKRSLSMLITMIIFSIAIFGVLLFIKQDPWIHQTIKNKVIQKLHAIDNHCVVHIDQAIWWWNSIILKNIAVYDTQKKWWWKADELKIYIPWFNILLQKKMDISFILERVILNSSIENRHPAIFDHIYQFLQLSSPSNNQYLIKNIVLNNSHIHMHNHAIQFSTNFSYAISEKNGSYNGKMRFHKAELSWLNKILYQQANGTIFTHFSLSDPSKNNFHMKSSGIAPLMHDTEFSITGHWERGILTAHFLGKDSLINGIMNYSAKGIINGKIKFPLIFFKSFYPNIHFINESEYGEVKIIGKSLFSHPTISAQLTTNQLSIDKSITFEKSEIKIEYCHQKYMNCTCIFSECVNKRVRLNFMADFIKRKIETNGTHNFSKSFLNIPYNNIHGIFHYTIHNKKNEYKIKHYITSNDQNKKIVTMNGIGIIDDAYMNFSGTIDNYEYIIQLIRNPSLHIKKCSLSDHTTQLLSIEKKEKNDVQGFIAPSVINQFLKFFKLNLFLNIPLFFSGSFKNNVIKFQGFIHNANMKIFDTYNLLKNGKMELIIDLQTKNFFIQNSEIEFYKGKITASMIRGSFNQKGISFLHAPLIINNFLMSKKKDFFGLISGTCVVTYDYYRKKYITGFVSIHNAHITNNIFSEEFKKQFESSSPLIKENPYDIQFSIQTHKPFTIKTPFIEGLAHLHMHMQGQLHNPILIGSMDIEQGLLLFPYKPLFIKKAQLIFSPQQADDPLISIIAENNIRKYTIRMTAEGTIKKPLINFVSTPILKEEQIIGMLLGGNEESLIFLSIPTTLIQSIGNLLFGPAYLSSEFQKNLKNLFAPFKHVRITPSFNDQSGRGGLRGTLAIDVNERLRAIIEKNFNLTEDAYIQVEYDLSDDARIRAIKDSRGDLGGEIEGRWKF